MIKPEKLIPLVIHNIEQMQPIPVYGDGQYTRDWLWVQDHVEAIDLIFHRGTPGETYNIGGNNEYKNIDLVSELCDLMDELLGRPVGASRQLIKFVKDRPGHDRRYAIDASKIRKALGWEPRVSVSEGLRQTASWYLENKEWLRQVSSGAYREYYEKQYGT
jgi:dTDP-glucose 4,6-dehydratase